MSIVVEFKDIKKSYGEKVALKGLSFQVKKGELLALLGPNGAGKSTALSLLTGLRVPDEGTLRVFGSSPREKQTKLKIGVTPQELSFPPLMKIKELIKFSANHYPNSLNVSEIAKKVGIENLLNRKAGGLSGGEKRKLGLAMALVGRPELLILDEPTTGMDIESRRDLWRVIQDLLKEGKTIVLTTHYLDEVEALAERVVVVDRGVSLFEGTVSEIKSKVDIKKVHFQLSDKQKKSNLENLDPKTYLKRNGSEYEVEFLTHDSDLFIKEIVIKKVEFKNLIVEEATLEEAFLEIRSRS